MCTELFRQQLAFSIKAPDSILLTRFVGTRGSPAPKILMQVVMGVLTFSTVDWSVVASCSPVIPMCHRWDSVGICSLNRKLQNKCGLRCLGNVCVRGVQGWSIFIIYR